MVHICYALNSCLVQGLSHSHILVNIMNHKPKLKHVVKHLNMPEIVCVLPEHTFTSAQKRSRPEMDKAIFNLPCIHHNLLMDVFRTKHLRKTAETPTIMPQPQSPDVNISPSCEQDFLETVSDECHKERIGKFIDTTGNNALGEDICVVCAGRFRQVDTEYVKISKLEEKGFLYPAQQHDAHILTNGMLLHRPPPWMAYSNRSQRTSPGCGVQFLHIFSLL